MKFAKTEGMNVGTFLEVDLTDAVTFVEIQATYATHFVKFDVTDAAKFVGRREMDSANFREQERYERDEVCVSGDTEFVRGSRPCKQGKEEGETTSARQQNRFHVLAPVSEHADEEVNAVDVLQEVQITVNSGAEKTFVLSKRKFVMRQKKEDGESGGGQRKSHSPRRRFHA